MALTIKFVLSFVLLFLVIALIMFFSIKNTDKKIKNELFKYERSQGREPLIIDKSNPPDFVIKSGNRTIHAIIFFDLDSDIPGINLASYDDSTYVYWMSYSYIRLAHPIRYISIAPPELIKKYDGKMPSPYKLYEKGEIKTEPIGERLTISEFIATANIAHVAIGLIIILIIEYSLKAFKFK